MRTCNFCNSDISHRHFNSTYCGLKCRDKHYSILRAEKLKLESIDFYKDKPLTSYVICQICGHCDADLSNHILKIHNMKCSDYKNKFNVSVVKCVDLCEKVKGENNPGYQHGGKFSPFSDKFLHNDGSIEAKQKQKEIKERMYANGLGKKENKQNNVEFWTSRGYTLKDAKIKVSERQRTFSLAKCIEQYGEIEGKQRWEERQEKWMKSLNDKSPDELLEINRRKRSLSVHDLRRFMYKNVGILYIIKLENGHIKIGITTNDLQKRYNKEFNKISKVILEKNIGLQIAFMYEQIIKKKLYDFRISKSECIIDAGWTEVFTVDEDTIIDMFNNITLENIVSEFISAYPKANKYFDEMTSIVNEEILKKHIIG